MIGWMTNRGRRRGTTTVELAMVAPLLIFLLFGIIEFGLMVKDLVGINQAAREGVRAAVVGATPAPLGTRLAGAAPTINVARLPRPCQVRDVARAAGVWGSWQTLGVDGAENDARPGDQIRIGVDYPHRLITGGLFGRLADDPDSGIIRLSTAIVMQRE